MSILSLVLEKTRRSDIGVGDSGLFEHGGGSVGMKSWANEFFSSSAFDCLHFSKETCYSKFKSQD